MTYGATSYRYSYIYFGSVQRFKVYLSVHLWCQNRTSSIGFLGESSGQMPADKRAELFLQYGKERIIYYCNQMGSGKQTGLGKSDYSYDWWLGTD